MIKDSQPYQIIEKHEHTILLKNNMKYMLKWDSHVLTYLTCGANNIEIECLKLINGSIRLKKIVNPNSLSENISLSEFNQENPEEQLDFRCNCHGFTFANGKFFINNDFVRDILEEEYTEINDQSAISSGYFDIVCFRNPDTQEYIHSCKYQYDLFIQKEGIRKFSIHASIDEVTKIEEYRNCTIEYYLRNQRSCPGICLNSVGQKHIKSFAND